MNKQIILTVGQLKERLKDVPDDTPVFYQRIEDVYFEKHGWKTEKLVWDFYAMEYIYSEYIPAFSCYKHTDEDVFVINAHY